MHADGYSCRFVCIASRDSSSKSTDSGDQSSIIRVVFPAPHRILYFLQQSHYSLFGSTCCRDLSIVEDGKKLTCSCPERRVKVSEFYSRSGIKLGKWYLIPLAILCFLTITTWILLARNEVGIEKKDSGLKVSDLVDYFE